MEHFTAAVPMRFAIELRDGSTLEVWADGYDLDGDHVTFSSLVDLREDGVELPGDTLVVGTTPTNPRRVVLAVARIPKTAVSLGEDGHPIVPAEPR